MGLRTGTDQDCQISRAADSQILIRKDSVSSRSGSGGGWGLRTHRQKGLALLRFEERRWKRFQTWLYCSMKRFQCLFSICNSGVILKIFQFLWEFSGFFEKSFSKNIDSSPGFPGFLVDCEERYLLQKSAAEDAAAVWSIKNERSISGFRKEEKKKVKRSK